MESPVRMVGPGPRFSPVLLSSDHEMMKSSSLCLGQGVRGEFHGFSSCLEHLLLCVILRGDISRHGFGLKLHAL